MTENEALDALEDAALALIEEFGWTAGQIATHLKDMFDYE